MTAKTARLLARLTELGFSWDEAMQLRRIEMTLQRWGELECGDGNDYGSWAIERDEQTGIPYMVRYLHSSQYVGEPKCTKRRIADREKGALARLSKIMAKHPEFVAYHQGDCRGCNLYLVPVKALAPGDKLDSVYTRGIAVCD